LPTRAPGRWSRAQARATKRALFVSSPIGLGHAQRDVAIARELRALVPGLEIDWLAQDPVTRVLEANGERIHPRSQDLAGESAHIEAEMQGEHTLHVFRAWRNMDEILLANFMIFHDAAREGNYDLWIGDEAWEVDYYLHENPELKTAPFAWLTDFVGWAPAEPDVDGRDPFLTADYNAEMVAQVERYPRVRDAAIFIGEPDDIVPDRFGEGLPYIREWTERHFAFSGYISPFDPQALPPREVLRERHAIAGDAPVAVAAVGGTRVGLGLLRRILAAWPHVQAVRPDLRLIVVRGPRICAGDLPDLPGVEYRDYVHNLYELLAAADVALVQGGLSTTMELVAAGRPFLYFPLTSHCEQNRHVAWRLERYGVPPERRIPFAEASPETIAARLVATLDEPVTYRPVAPGGARRAAERFAALL
jgi:predicted glycosyltransferase